MKKLLQTLLSFILFLSLFTITPIQAEESYTLTYDLCGGEGIAPIDSKTYGEDDYALLSEDTGFTKEGVPFAYWSTNPTYVEDEEMYVYYYTGFTSNVTLYARYFQKVTITYDTNGATSGVAPADSGSYRRGQQVCAKSGTSLKKNDIPFAYWSTNKDYVKGEEQYTYYFFIEDNTYLYARYLSPVKVTYNINGATSGTTPIDNNEYTFGTYIDLADGSKLKKGNQSFAYWSTNQTYVEEEEKYSLSTLAETDLYLYARYQTEINIHYGDASTTTSGTIGVYAVEEEDVYDCIQDTIKEQPESFDTPGYQIEGFYTDGTYQNALVDNTLYVGSNAIDIYAKLTPIQNNVTIVQSEHGTISIDKTSAYANEPIAVTSTPEEGYVLKEIEVDGLGEYSSFCYVAEVTTTQNPVRNVYNNGYPTTLTPLFVKPILLSEIKALGEEGMIVKAGEVLCFDLGSYEDFEIYSMEAAVELSLLSEYKKSDFIKQMGEEAFKKRAGYYQNSEEIEDYQYAMEDGTLCTIDSTLYFNNNVFTDVQDPYISTQAEKYLIKVDNQNNIVAIALGTNSPAIYEINGNLDLSSGISYNQEEASDLSLHIGYYSLYEFEDSTDKHDRIVTKLDGRKLNEGSEVEYASGSIIVNINKDVLNALSSGSHTLSIDLLEENKTDILDNFSFSIQINPSTSSIVIPKTGVE